ncbi:hypothetical protein PPTG_09443 [Phytophthora nicotianae INRA-310]|uniref:Uncharacterized protein n=1 Tax=Phytophthora nicotianae (strain INRA-310) TaxID=761204 RepID=W2QGU2_PHYN3|nr:hypothetical protein PPTG_09443 [Phytophthora nicotianae INRA-310]ETN11734.1 hypothetical protein PPTG_09443 [Phytophthora nicotianae INRA-310]
MASLDTLVLYEHILSLVDPTELHRSSNSVLQKKFFDLAKSVSDVVATFAKVEEVRDAMNQLEQGNVLTGRSDSLMREMENSMNLQQKLEEALKKVTMEIAVSEKDVDITEETQTQAKHKRGRGMAIEHEREDMVVSESCSGSSSSCSSEEEGDMPTKKKSKGTEAALQDLETTPQLKTMDPCLHLAQECLNTILKVKIKSKKIPGGMKARWSNAVIGIKDVLKQQAACNAVTTDNTIARVTTRALESAMAIFEQVEWTVERFYEIQLLSAALTGACSTNKALMSDYQVAQVKLDKVVKESCRPLVRKIEQDNAGRVLGHLVGTFRGLVKSVETLQCDEKPQRIAEVLSMIEIVMKVDSECKREKDIRRTVEQASVWVATVPLHGDFLPSRFQRFVTKAVTYMKNMEGNQSDLRSTATSITKVLSRRK